MYSQAARCLAIHNQAATMFRFRLGWSVVPGDGGWQRFAMDTSDLVYIAGTIDVGKRNEGISAMQLNSPVAHLVSPTTIQLVPKRYELGMIVLYAEDLVEVFASTSWQRLMRGGKNYDDSAHLGENRRKRITPQASIVNSKPS